jgi:predicted nucleic acid-binding protein
MKWWDTSALLSILLEQEATEDLKGLLASDQDIAVWWGTKVESISAVSRLQREGHLEQAAASHVLKQLDLLLSSAWEVQPLEEVRATACRALRVHELRAADALQLAAALVWTEHRPTGMGFVCLDRRLREAAMREGFELSPGS